MSTSTPTRLFSRGLSSLADADSGTRLVMSTPESDPTLWRDYLDGARRTYERHGVGVALDFDAVADGADTAVFFAAVDRAGDVVAGVRGQGPYLSALESHALVEWEGNAAQPAVAAMIDGRLEDGVVEMKSAWVAADAENPGALSALLSRTALPTMVFSGARYVLATAADHVLRRWESGGGRVAEDIAPAAYPDERYRTRMMWWDRFSIADDVEPEVWARMIREAAILTGAEATVAA